MRPWYLLIVEGGLQGLDCEASRKTSAVRVEIEGHGVIRYVALQLRLEVFHSTPNCFVSRRCSDMSPKAHQTHQAQDSVKTPASFRSKPRNTTSLRMTLCHR